jgi:hypothetical protein
MFLSRESGIDNSPWAKIRFIRGGAKMSVKSLLDAWLGPRMKFNWADGLFFVLVIIGVPTALGILITSELPPSFVGGFFTWIMFAFIAIGGIFYTALLFLLITFVVYRDSSLDIVKAIRYVMIIAIVVSIFIILLGIIKNTLSSL